jgi:hypothetical protein
MQVEEREVVSRVKTAAETACRPQPPSSSSSVAVAPKPRLSAIS